MSAHQGPRHWQGSLGFPKKQRAMADCQVLWWRRNRLSSCRRQRGPVVRPGCQFRVPHTCGCFVEQIAIGHRASSGHAMFAHRNRASPSIRGTGGGQVGAATLNYVAKKLARYGKRLRLT
jgi:hypothetical protein